MKFNLKNNDNNRNLFIGLFVVIIFVWTIFYFIPELMVFFLNTFLGNILFFILLIIISYKNIKYALLFGLLYIILYRIAYIFYKKNIKEGFQWTNESQQNFLNLQTTLNRNSIFDLNVIQDQASQEEVNYFNENGIWPWSNNTKILFGHIMENNSYIRNNPKMLMYDAQTKYNENAILKLLSWQTKEGNFLLSGININNDLSNNSYNLPSGYGDFVTNSGLQKPRNPIIKCGKSKNFNNEFILQQTNYNGYENILNTQSYTINDLSINNLENIIPGFKFVNGPCNPCSPLNNMNDYSCPFKINLKNNKQPEMSPIWSYLWGLGNPLESLENLVYKPNLNSKDFPILSQVQKNMKTLLYQDDTTSF